MANDIEKVRAQAHDANVANKIIDSLKELQQSSDEKSRCRWVWELIQNAKDVANSSGSVDVKISFNEQQRILQFAHNGKPFSMQNIVFLIEQVSTKDRDEKEETKKSTGKFGTGFLTTHLLSEIVTISGVLQDENSQFKKFELDINRSEKTREGIIGGNKKSFEQLQNSIDNGEMIFDFNEDLFNTSFTYRINENGLAVAKEGLDNLYDALPYVFMFVPEIRSVSVEEYAWKFTRGKLCLTQNKDIKVQEIIVRENEEESGTYIAAIQGANVAIAAEVEKHGNHVAVKEFTNQLSRIFCDFPLICSLQDIFASIKNGLSSYPEQKDNIYSQIVVLYTNDDEVSDLERKQTELLEFADVIFPNRLPNDLEVSAISPELLEEAIKYLCIQVVDEISKYENLENLNWLFNFNEETIEKWISRFIEYINAEGYGFLLDRKVKTILPNQNGKFKAKEELFLDNGDMDEILKDISAIAGYDIREELLLGDVFLALPDNRTKSIADIAPHVVSYVKKNQGSSKVQDSNVMDTFKKLYYWVKDNSEKAEKYFNEICENIHWLYNDVEIAENMKKAEQIDAVLERCHINDISILEKAFLKMANSMQEADSVINSDEEENEEELLVQYGIASEEQYEKALDMQIFKENFLHTSSHDVSKFDFANRILERAKNNIIEFLGKKSEYNILNLIEVDKTIFIIEKNKEQIYLITRPSDYSYVAIYYDSEKNVLDYNKDWELWVEDGKKEPEKITFGKMLKLTGINKIPLKKV